MSQNVGEYIGFRTQPGFWPDLIWPSEPSWPGGVPNLQLDARVFIHLRDYTAKMPESYQGMWTQETSAYTRVFDLYPDGTYSSISVWSGYMPSVSKLREACFAQELLGYAYQDYTGSAIALRRKLPVPIDWQGGSSSVWRYPDYRGNVIGNTAGYTNYNVLRYTHWATKILKVEGVAMNGQDLREATGWSPSNQYYNSPANETYKILRFHVLFEQPNYLQMLAYGQSAPYAPGIGSTITDPAYAGEYSRNCLYQIDPKSKAIQVRGGIVWDITSGDFGQPSPFTLAPNANPTAIGAGPSGAKPTVYASSEGQPKLQGSGMVVLKWLDVPWGCFNQAKIQGMFGTVNNADFPYSTGISPSPAPPSPFPAPYRTWGRETMLLETAAFLEKGNNIGPPLFDITFYFNTLRGSFTDSKGVLQYESWNTLLNTYNVFQVYQNPQGAPFYEGSDFTKLFTGSPT